MKKRKQVQTARLGSTDYKHKDLSNRHYVEWINFLSMVDAGSLSARDLREYQLFRFRNEIAPRAWLTPGYQRLWKSVGIESPNDIQTWEDFRRLPTIDKATLRDNIADFTFGEMLKNEYVTTGGSTGIPLGFYRNARAFGRELASKAWQYYRMGWREGDAQAVFRGTVINEENHMKYFPEYNEFRFSTYHLTPEQMSEYIHIIRTHQPKWIRAYPSALTIFAKWMLREKLDIPKPKGILLASENVYDWQKSLFDNVFKCRVFSHYGQYEQTVLAGYCEYNDLYHVFPAYGIAEVVDSRGQLVRKRNQVGEVIGTSLIAEPTLFIKYKTQDRVRYYGAGCKECGREFELWSEIEGREQDFIITKNGRKISIAALNFHDDIFDGIKEFQFRQKNDGVVSFLFIPRESVAVSELSPQIKKRLKSKLRGVEIIMVMVSEIPKSSRGKHRFFVRE